MGQRDEKLPREASWPELEEIYWPAKWTRANPEEGHKEEEGYDPHKINLKSYRLHRL